jgi:hypothetical protein
MGDAMERKSQIIISSLAAVVIMVGASLFFITRYERISKVKKYLASVCVDESVSRTEPDAITAVGNLNKCEFGQSSQAESIAALPDYQLVQQLIAICVNSPGAVSQVDLLEQRLKAIDGEPSQSSEEICRDRVWTAFPELK